MRRVNGVWLGVLLALPAGMGTAWGTDIERGAGVLRKAAPVMAPRMRQLTPLIQQGDLPELTLHSITFSPGKPLPGQQVTVWVKVWNTGKVDSAPTEVALKLRATHPLQGSAPPVLSASAPVAAVRPNMAGVATFNITLNGATSGQWKAEAVVDPYNRVVERDETNNSMYQLFQVM
ncbi:MAG: hypothetical protein G8D58_05825 [gamma proteobacterium symbiont of Phacoides pectinatus]